MANAKGSGSAENARRRDGNLILEAAKDERLVFVAARGGLTVASDTTSLDSFRFKRLVLKNATGAFDA